MEMNPDRLRQIEELYHLAGEQTPEEREAFLTKVCGNDAELLRDVLALLAQDSAAGPMEQPVMEVAAKLLADSAWTPGAQVGPYQIVSRIGKGGMGEVFKARDTCLGREVAIKTAHEEFSGRFQREARAISALNHPNICTLYDVGPNYLVMELVEGPTLADRIKQGAIALDETLAIAEQIADALDTAHQKGIVHRDLKPANIKVSETGNVKVLDFGLAKTVETSGPSGDPSASPTLTLEVTRAGMILGTAAYMSPEQARGKPVDKRADIWAFGVVLYEMVTGRALFKGEDVSETLAAVIKQEPDLSGAPPELQKLLQRCLAKDPNKRLRDMGDWRLLLDDTPSDPARQGEGKWLWPVVAALEAAIAPVPVEERRETQRQLATRLLGTLPQPVFRQPDVRGHHGTDPATLPRRPYLASFRSPHFRR